MPRCPPPVLLRCQSEIIAVSDATRKSNGRMSSSAPVVQKPSITAIEGFSMSSMRFITELASHSGVRPTSE